MLRPIHWTLPFILIAACSAPAPDTISSRSEPVLDGTPSVHTGVVLIQNPVEWCTGWMLLPDLVLTARHCVGPVDGTSCETYTDSNGVLHSAATPGVPYAPGELGVNLQAKVPYSPVFEPVTEVITLEGEGGSAPLLCGNDLALLRLVHPLDGAVTIEPRLDLPPLLGEEVKVVGYGQTGGGDPNTAGTRLEHAGALVQKLGPVLNSSGLLRATEAEWIIDTGPCFGDSGSPALDIDGRSIGVMSRGAGAVCKSMIYGMVSAHSAWLRAQVAKVAADTGVPAPSWVTPPLDASAPFWAPCRGSSECDAPFECLPADGHFRCTTTDCSACPSGSSCLSDAAAQVCAVEPVDSGAGGSGGASAEGGAPAGSAGAPAGSAGAPEGDGGANQGVDAASEELTPSDSSGCAVRAAPPRSRGTMVIALAIALLVSLRLRPRISHIRQ